MLVECISKCYTAFNTYLIIVGTLPHIYSNLLYDAHTVTVQAQSSSSSITIMQKGKYCINCNIVNYIKFVKFLVLMVMAEIGIFNGTAIILHIQSTLPAVYRCQLNGGEYFSCKVCLHIILKEPRPFCR